jgi:cell division protein FtsW (lipid II flippase)
MSARRLIRNLDRPLVLVIFFLCLLGLYNLSSASQALGNQFELSQLRNMSVGLVLMFAVASIDYRSFEGLSIGFFVLVVGLLIATSLFGLTINGSRRWLPIPGLFNLQTSDIAKIGVILIVARVLHVDGESGQGLTLNDIFRPFNMSRPLIVIALVLMIGVGGDGFRPTKLQRKIGTRMRTVATFSQDRAEFVAGQSEKADIRLGFAGTAARHAKFSRLEDGHYSVISLDPNAEIKVNGEKIEGAYRLFDQDVIKLGKASGASLKISAPIEPLRRRLPWIAILGAFFLFLSIYLQLQKPKLTARDVVAPIDVVAIPCVLILTQPDLGTTIVTLLIAFSIILYVGLRPISLVMLVFFSLAGSILAWLVLLKPYQKERVMTFLNPSSDLLGAGYHQHQSLIAIGSGEFWGKGFGQGTQTQLKFLPEQQTDFIFSVWAEEHGFIGCVVAVALFAALILLCLRVAFAAKDRFGALLVVGVTAMLFWHTVINMLMVLRLAPVVGVPLPLWSYGGSFVVTTMVGLGIVLNVGIRRHVF